MFARFRMPAFIARWQMTQIIKRSYIHLLIVFSKTEVTMPIIISINIFKRIEEMNIFDRINIGEIKMTNYLIKKNITLFYINKDYINNR